MASTKLVWFVTGANSGLGLRITEYALSQGHVVIATARDLSKFPGSLKNNADADLIELEIAGPASAIVAAVDAAASKHGHIDVLVNNAGYGLMGALEELTEASIRYQFDVNFFGLVNTTKAVLPHMKKQSSGIILQISSVGGFIGLEGSPLYIASKFAVEGFAESFAQEVKRFGVRVHIIEPGFLRTKFAEAVTQGKNIGVRKDGYVDMKDLLTGINGNQPGDPAKCAERIFEIATGAGLAKEKQEELRFVLGSDSLGLLNMKIKSLSDTAEKMKEIAPSIDF
jgi:NAD(P)-dependent dehydrogenase (short-subunit alcohol dehydrogenase family)